MIENIDQNDWIRVNFAYDPRLEICYSKRMLDKCFPQNEKTPALDHLHKINKILGTKIKLTEPYNLEFYQKNALLGFCKIRLKINQFEFVSDFRPKLITFFKLEVVVNEGDISQFMTFLMAAIVVAKSDQTTIFNLGTCR